MVEEKLVVTSREQVTDEITVDKIVHNQTVEVPLTRIDTHYREFRIPQNRVVETMPEVRYEGKNLIVPVVREEEVVIKRLVLVEEIHLIQEVDTSERTESVTLRSEDVTVSRKPAQ
ncbi:DUF2382 domain-containing protein [Neolewinella xylanilytica]|uniref:DUF2382 domain-containing protein n=1 Tax=Neolewinella xylanilytica TaxID=1514080 RepID=UPI001473A895|nr:DUF2382 domain-containing protein [Neolewinella xylanilytica]